MVLRRPGQSEPEVSGSGAMGAAQLYIAPERLSPAERQSPRLTTSRLHGWGCPCGGPRRNSAASARNRANRAGPQFRLMTEAHAHRTQCHELSRDRVVNGDNDSECRAFHPSRELCRYRRADRDGVGAQHVAATHIEAPVGVEHDASNHIAERAADVDVGRGIRRDNSRTVAPPCTEGDLSSSGRIQGVTRRARGGKNCGREKAASKGATNARRTKHARDGHGGEGRP